MTSRDEQTDSDPGPERSGVDSTPQAAWDAHYVAGRGWRPVIDTEKQLLRQYLGTGHGLRALDIACGTGGYAHAIHELGYAVTGIDYAPAAIEAARAAYPGLQFLELDIEQGNLARLDSSYDLITCRLAYAFMQDQAVFMDRVRGLLAGGGTFHITTPVTSRMPDGDPRHIGISDADVAELLATPWADVSTYDIDYLTCYTLRVREDGDDDD